MRYVTLICLALCALLTGCSALPYAHQIDKTVLMEVLGVDAGVGETVTVTAASGARSGEQDPLVLSAQAGTISAACADMGQRGEDFVFLMWNRCWWGKRRPGVVWSPCWDTWPGTRSCGWRRSCGW